MERSAEACVCVTGQPLHRGHCQVGPLCSVTEVVCWTSQHVAVLLKVGAAVLTSLPDSFSLNGRRGLRVGFPCGVQTHVTLRSPTAVHRQGLVGTRVRLLQKLIPEQL